jgi:uncharacterized protein
MRNHLNEPRRLLVQKGNPLTDKKIAIIGAGVSGLVAAYLLKERYEITIFESNDYVGGHTHTIEVDNGSQSIAVDTGFIVYNEKNYPLFTELLAQLQVETQPSLMSFSVCSDQSNFEYNGSSINQLFSQRRNLISPKFYRMLGDIHRFNRHAEELAEMSSDSMTVGQYVSANKFSDSFLEQYLIPIGASLWSCPIGKFREFPIRFVIEFLRNHGMLQIGDRPQWRVVKGGSARYVERLTEGFNDQIRLQSPVKTVYRSDDGVFVQVGDSTREDFDHVIFACHSDQALRMLDQPTKAETQVLGAFPYQLNHATLHTDQAVLPRKKRAWGSWNYRIGSANCDEVAITYNMNMLQSIDTKDQYLVTLNDRDRIDSSKVIRSMIYHHPIYTPSRSDAQSQHKNLIGVNRTSFCGAYWGYGFHEDGVRSAVDVAAHFGCSL